LSIAVAIGENVQPAITLAPFDKAPMLFRPRPAYFMQAANYQQNQPTAPVIRLSFIVGL
jgi:hypothetical protein